jgi:hypothetical protein
MKKPPLIGRPRTSPLTRAEQLRAAKRAQRERQRAAGIRPVELALEDRQAARFRAAAASPHFPAAFDRLLGDLAVDRTAWPVLRDITWNRADRWIPADEALALYERNWRHVDAAHLGTDEAELIRRLADRFGGGIFNG